MNAPTQYAYKYLSWILLTTSFTMIILIMFFVFFYERYESVAIRTKLIIDQDGGADDSIAIFMALLYEQYFNGPKVLALTTTHGNVDEHQVFINNQKILGVAGRWDIPIYRGCNKSLVFDSKSDYFFGTDGLGEANLEFQAIPAQSVHAALALIELANIYEGELIVVALGALTNIGIAIRLDPTFIDKLSHLYVGAGHIRSEEYPNPEFNANMDAESYHIVVGNARPDKVTLIPFSQVLLSTNISRTWRQEVLGSIPTEIISAQNIFEQISLPKKEKWTLLDPAVMGTVLDKSIITETKYSENGIILCGDERGINTNNFNDPADANVNVVYGIHEDSYKQLLLDIFSAQLADEI